MLPQLPMCDSGFSMQRLLMQVVWVGYQKFRWGTTWCVFLYSATIEILQSLLKVMHVVALAKLFANLNECAHTLEIKSPGDFQTDCVVVADLGQQVAKVVFFGDLD